MLNGSILVRPGGHCFSPVSSSRSAQSKKLKADASLASMRPKRARRNLRGSSLLKSSLAQFSGLLHQSPPPILLLTRRVVHQTISMFQGLTARPSFTHSHFTWYWPPRGQHHSLAATNHFWWPNMARDVRRYVQGCPDCAISRSPRHLPADKLNPLPIPRFVGPFTILEQINPVTYRLQLPLQYKITPHSMCHYLNPSLLLFRRAWQDRWTPSPSNHRRRSYLQGKGDPGIPAPWW